MIIRFSNSLSGSHEQIGGGDIHRTRVFCKIKDVASRRNDRNRARGRIFRAGAQFAQHDITRCRLVTNVAIVALRQRPINHADARASLHIDRLASGKGSNIADLSALGYHRTCIDADVAICAHHTGLDIHRSGCCIQQDVRAAACGCDTKNILVCGIGNDDVARCAVQHDVTRSGQRRQIFLAVCR